MRRSSQAVSRSAPSGTCRGVRNDSEELAMSGTTDEYKGRAKEALGDLTDDKDLQREGKVDQASGKAKQVAEDAKDKVGDAIDSVKDKLHKD
jgi:uncharacterized protein YjbJ (UPF0337 family)